jgi:ABC-type amino acid transport substrate-binding protein
MLSNGNKEYSIVFCLAAFMAIVLLLGLTSCAPVQTDKQAADNSLSDIKAKGTLVVGTYPVIEPMSFIDDSEAVVGFDMDVAGEIARQLGVAMEIKQMNFQDLIPAAQNGEIDLIACVMTITPERAEQVLFSIPYFSTGQMIITRKDNNDINQPEDLKGKKVGAQRGTTAEKAALQYVNSSFLVLYDDWTLAPDDLKNGKTDAILFDIGAFGLVKDNPELKIVGAPITQEYYGLATKLGNDALMDEINSVLREMKRNGELDSLNSKWGLT